MAFLRIPFWPFTRRPPVLTPGRPVHPARLHVAVTSRGIALVRALQRMMAVVIMGSLAAAGWCWWKSQSLEDTAVRYETASARTQELNRQFAEHMKRDGLTLSTQQITTVKREVAFANQLADKRAFSWARLLSDLGDVVPPRVSISSVRLNFQDSTVALHGTTLTLQDLNTLVDKLQNHGAFRKAALSDHRVQEPQDGKGGRPQGVAPEGVEFNLTVVYRPTF